MIYLGLGTNLGDREANLRQAIVALSNSGIDVLRASSLYETAPRDLEDQPWFLNLVIECRTPLMPLQLIRKLMRIEKQLGRDRRQTAIPRGPRLIDIDILMFHAAVIDTPHLKVPHPRLRERRFVLEPLLELVPNLRDPSTGEPLKNALAAVLEQQVEKLPVQIS